MNRFALLAVALAVPAALAFSAPKPADASVIVTMQVPTVLVTLGGPTVVEHDRDSRVADRDDRCDRDGRYDQDARFDRDGRYDRAARFAAYRRADQERLERERAEMLAMRRDDHRGVGHAWGHDRDDRRR